MPVIRQTAVTSAPPPSSLLPLSRLFSRQATATHLWLLVYPTDVCVPFPGRALQVADGSSAGFIHECTTALTSARWAAEACGKHLVQEDTWFGSSGFGLKKGEKKTKSFSKASCSTAECFHQTNSLLCFSVTTFQVFSPDDIYICICIHIMYNICM